MAILRDVDAPFSEYVATRSTVLMGTAMRLCGGDRAGAEDLVQATLLRTYLSWHRVKDEGARDAYVRRTMVRLHHRGAGRRGPISMAPEAIPEDITDDTRPSTFESRDLLWPLLKGLPTRQRTVIVLRYYLDLSEQEIADAIGCSRGAVKSHASRAIQKLRAQLPLPAAPSAEGRDNVDVDH